MQPRLAATDLSCRRGGRLLFGGVSFDLGPGEALHVAGPNGVGKSSLLRQLAGLLRAFTGSVERDGRLGLASDTLALDRDMPLGSALRFWETLDASDDPQRIHDTLGLTKLLDVPVRYLSTGQRKRAALARLAGSGSAIWLLDEPLNGLDADARSIVTRMFGDHCAAGGICVFASHQPLGVDAASLDLERYS